MVVCGIRLLMDSSWSTATVEQAHASCSLVRRHHPDYHLEHLVVRAGIHAARRLLPDPDARMKAEAKLQKHMGKLLDQRPGRISSARLYLFKGLIDAMVAVQTRNGQAVSEELIMRICKLRGQRWTRLAPHQKAVLQAEADMSVQHTEQALAAPQVKIANAIQQVRDTTGHQARATPTTPLMLSVCELSSIDVGRWQAEYDSLQARPTLLAERRNAASHAPGILQRTRCRTWARRTSRSAPGNQRRQHGSAPSCPCENSSVPLA